MVGAPSPSKDFRDLIAREKADPGKITYGTSGKGSINQLLSESLNVEARIKMVHVPYKAIAPALVDVAGGTVDNAFAAVPSALQLIKGGKLRHCGVERRLKAEAVPGIRRRIWRKLLRNAPLNSVCALTRLPVDQLAREPQLQQLCNAVIDEIAAIALANGHDLNDQLDAVRSAISLGAAIDGRATRSVRPSMLQDVESGRPMEVQSILGQVQAFSRAAGTPCPALDVLVVLICGLDLRSSS